LAQVIQDVDADLVVVSYNNEAWISAEELNAMCRARDVDVRMLEFDSKRYVGAQIGIHNPQGKKVGRVSHLRNVEYVVCAGDTALLDELISGAQAGAPQAAHDLAR
jgi:adenine-specific DNA-methyltransferase